MYRNGLLPFDTFSAKRKWLKRGEDYRQLMEQVDIVDYYRRELWRFKPPEQLHYLDSNNRPDTYVFLEHKWVEAHEPGYPLVDSTQAAVEEAAYL